MVLGRVRKPCCRTDGREENLAGRYTTKQYLDGEKEGEIAMPKRTPSLDKDRANTMTWQLRTCLHSPSQIILDNRGTAGLSLCREACQTPAI